MSIKYVIFPVFMILCTNIFAQDLITDRPDQTESSSTVMEGSLQIETGALLQFLEAGQHVSKSILAPSTLFRYGLTGGLEIRLLSQYETIKSDFGNVDGISDLEIGFKVQLLKKENTNTEIAFLSHLIIPTGTEFISSGEYGTINKLSIAHELNESTGLGYNIGYDNFGYGNGNLTYSIAVGKSINDKAGFFVESYGELEEFEEFILHADAGFTYLIKPNFQLDFSFGTSLTDDYNFISSGFSWRLDK